MATTIVPTEALRMALERASTRAHAPDEERALSELRACLERQLYALPMPTPKGGPVTFSYPLEFRASE